MREHIDIVVRRQRDGDLELPRQVGAAEDRFVLDLAAGDLLLAQPDLVPGAGARQQMDRDVARQFADRGVQIPPPRIGRGDDVAVDVAAGGDGVQHVVVQPLHQRPQIALQDAVELHRLTRRQADRVVGPLQRQLLDAQPLLRRQDAGRHPHPHHEAEGLLHPLLAAFGAQVAVILLVEAVEFRQLRVVVGQRAGFDMGQPLGDGAAQQIAGLP